MNTAEQTLPVPPPGYQPGYRLRYSAWALNLAGVILFLAALPLFGWLTWLLQGAPTDTSFTVQLGSRVQLLFVLIAVFGVPLLTIVIHELIHGLVFRLFGYRVSYGFVWHLPAAYAAAFGQFQHRRHAIAVALAPLVVLTLALVPLLSSRHPGVVGLALMALLVNTAGAVGDLYVTWRLLRLPQGSLLYDVDPMQMYMFEPARG